MKLTRRNKAIGIGQAFSTSTLSKRQTLRSAFTYSSIFLVALGIRLIVASSVDMTWDEGLYTLCGMVALRNLLVLNFYPDAWSFEFHPPVVMILFGLSFAIYIFIATVSQSGMILNLEFFYGRALALFSGYSSLLMVRLPSAVLGALSCVMVFIFSSEVFKNKGAGLIGAFLLAFTPSFIAFTSLAMLDGGVAFFYILTVLLFYRSIHRKSLKYMVLSGLSLGLAFGTKETSFAIPIVGVFWLFLRAAKAWLSSGRGGIQRILENLKTYWFVPLWIPLGLLTFYGTWPWLWNDPISKFASTFQSYGSWGSAQGFMFGSVDYYGVNLLVTTPIVLLVLFLIGTFTVFREEKTKDAAILFLVWFFVPLAIMSTPFVPKRGGANQIIFLLPSLCMVAGHGGSEIIGRLERLRSFSPPKGGQFLRSKKVATALACVVLMAPVAIECWYINPYYLDYYNQLVGGMEGAKDHFYVGWWGEGMAEAIAYVDEHAPLNSSVLIYGPRGTAFYHSTRVNLRNSLREEALFFVRGAADTAESIGFPLEEWRNGDLTFRFPYYRQGEPVILDTVSLRSASVSYILVYRWAVHNRLQTLLDQNNFEVVSDLRANYTPTHTIRIKGIEVCWIYGPFY